MVAVTVTYLHSDWLGSPRLATDASGNVLWREHFDPYGKKLSNVAEKRGFTGHAYDAETGNTYMLARYYDADVGRFLMTDPIGSKDDLNLYAYVGGNPTNSTDPTGTATVEELKDAIYLDAVHSSANSVTSSAGAAHGAGGSGGIVTSVTINAKGVTGTVVASSVFTGTSIEVAGTASVDIAGQSATVKLGQYFSAQYKSGNLIFDVGTEKAGFSISSEGKIEGRSGIAFVNLSDFGRTLDSLGLKAAGTSVTFSNFSPNSVDFSVQATPNVSFLGVNLGQFVSVKYNGSFDPNPNTAVLNSSGLLGRAARTVRDKPQSADDYVTNAVQNGPQ